LSNSIQTTSVFQEFQALLSVDLPLQEDSVVRKVQEIARFAHTPVDCDCLLDSLSTNRKITVEAPSIVFVREAIEAKKNILESSDFSFGTLFNLASEIRKKPFLQAIISKEDFLDRDLPVLFQNVEKRIPFYKLLLLAINSEFVLGQLESVEDVVYLPTSPDFVIEQIITCLQQEEALTSFEELLSLMGAAHFILDEKAFACIDSALAESLRSMQISDRYKEAPIYQQLVDILNLFREHPNSLVHQELRKEFTPLVLQEIENPLPDEQLASLAPPLEFKITYANLHLLNHPVVRSQLTHCTIDNGAREFYGSVLENLPFKVFQNIAVESRFFLMQVPVDYRNDRHVVLASVRRNGQMLRYASDQWRNDRKVVEEAVAQFGGALQFASEEFKDDEQMVYKAILQDPRALQYASARLQKFFKKETLF